MRNRGAWISLTTAATILTVSSCSSGASAGKPSSAPTTATDAPTQVTMSPTPNANVTACTRVQTLVFAKIKPTFAQYGRDKILLDKPVGKQLRAEGTSLFSIAANATGATASAIQNEATGLTNISIGIATNDSSLVGKSAVTANTGLAALRGVCNF